MFPKPIEIAPLRATDLLAAAEAAARAIPPAFPLDATVAVNPMLGQTGEDLATAAARLARVSGARIIPERAGHAAAIAAGTITDADLEQALAASPWALKPASLQALKAAMTRPAAPAPVLPSLAELAARADGIDWPMVITRSIGLWAAGHFDRGQALWTPAPGRGALAGWRDWASHDLTPEIAGLRGFCAHVAASPDTAERAILRACDALGLTEAAAPTLFHALLIQLRGWSQHARWLLWQAEMQGGTDAALTDLLAIRLIWDEALLARDPALAARWAEVVAAHEAPVAPDADTVLDAILQDAAERAHQRKLAALLSGPRPAPARPAMQAAFCIDVRSEVFRRALESQDPGIQTLGFAGFFGLPVAHLPQGSDHPETHLPVLLNPAMTATSHAAPAAEQRLRIGARAERAWGRFRQAAVSSFAFVEAAGPAYGLKLLGSALGRAGAHPGHGPAPRLDPAPDPATKADTAAAVLRAMSLTRGHARLILLVGHGAQVTNNPHESGYHCGACGGQTGAVSARLLAGLLNDPETRAGLPARGIDLPSDTLFVAGLHDTTTDRITVFDEALPLSHRADLTQGRGWLDRATGLARAERAARLPGASAATIASRARDWSEIRPEWGLAGCAAFIAAPREATAGRDLSGRAFLHSYDWRQDEGFGTLELILTAPVVVASWISLQYYGSAVAPDIFGGGNKLIHNVVGGIGVVQGNGGLLRPGLPWQAIHDGEALAHEPLRLSVMVEAPQDAISAILARHEGLRALFDNGWLHLLALDNGRVTARYADGGEWISLP